MVSYFLYALHFLECMGNNKHARKNFKAIDKEF